VSAQTTGELLSPQLRALFDGTNYVHVATVMPDGSPHTLPAWAMIEGDHILVGTGSQGDKGKNLSRDGRVSISVASRRDLNKIAHIRGRVVKEVDADHGSNEIMDRISHHYIGREHPAPGPTRVIFYIEADIVDYSELTMPYPPLEATASSRTDLA
jgi:PPOX class probable F420-dependent enzyme